MFGQHFPLAGSSRKLQWSSVPQDNGYVNHQLISCAPYLFLAKLAEELGVSIDYLVSGKEGIINGAIPAIKADKRLNLKAKRALIALAEEFRELALSEEAKGETPGGVAVVSHYAI